MSEMNSIREPIPIDEQNQLTFSASFDHRVWFCDDVLRRGDILSKVLATEQTATRVQIWVDEGVLASNSDYVGQIADWVDHQTLLQLSRPPQPLPGGEVCKNDPTVLQRILQAVHDDGLDRRSYLIVIGGGAVLDVVGYAASIAHRGIRLVRLPSTTLSQSDSGVGVKNAVNAFGKKNWLGTFAVPWAVVNDYRFLRSQPDRAFISGFSESIKVALLKSTLGFDWIDQNVPAIIDRDEAVTKKLIYESAMMHARHITNGGDPFELLEARPLDFGHWSAHAMESISGYEIAHGDAVAAGVALDVVYSSLTHGLSDSAAARIVSCMRRMGLPLWNPVLADDPDRVLDGLEEFRQHLGGRLTVTMLSEIGRPIDVHEISMSAMRQAMQQLQTMASN